MTQMLTQSERILRKIKLLHLQSALADKTTTFCQKAYICIGKRCFYQTMPKIFYENETGNY
jgi:hypothetical protein